MTRADDFCKCSNAAVIVHFARTAGWLLKSPNLFATVISAFLFRKLEVFGWRVLHGGIALLALDELMYVGL
jgi:hypothetical protein